MGEIARSEGIDPKRTPSFPIPQDAEQMKVVVDRLLISEQWKDRLRALPMFRDFDPIPKIMHNLRNQDLHRHVLLSAPSPDKIEFKGNGALGLFLLYRSFFNTGDLVYIIEQKGDIEPIIRLKLLLLDPETGSALDAWETLSAFEEQCREILTWLSKTTL